MKEASVLILPSDVSDELLASIREHAWTFSTSLFALRSGAEPAYYGTGTFVTASGIGYLVTAAHVWGGLERAEVGFAHSADQELVVVQRSVLEARCLTPTKAAHLGPDLAAVRLPDLLVARLARRKVFYNLDLRRNQSTATDLYERGMWSLIGAPAEQSRFEPKEAILKLSLFGTTIEKAYAKEGLDYLDLRYSRGPGRPKSYGGLSGSGVWRTVLNKSESTGFVEWDGVATLEGVAFYQEPTSEDGGVIRCHGRGSIFGVTYA